MRFEISKAIKMEIVIFWDTTQNSLVDRYQCFVKTCCHKLQDRKVSLILSLTIINVFMSAQRGLNSRAVTLIQCYMLRLQFHAKYRFKDRSDNAPHIFSVADRAYQDMLHHEEPQYILLAGETVSGKTTNMLHLLRHLLFLGQVTVHCRPKGVLLENRIFH